MSTLERDEDQETQCGTAMDDDLVIDEEGPVAMPGLVCALDQRHWAMANHSCAVRQTVLEVFPSEEMRHVLDFLNDVADEGFTGSDLLRQLLPVPPVGGGTHAQLGGADQREARVERIERRAHGLRDGGCVDQARGRTASAARPNVRQMDRHDVRYLNQPVFSH